MRAARGALVVLLALSPACAPPADGVDLATLYKSHRWFDLRDALRRGEGASLYRGAVAAAFNDIHEAELVLGTVIDAAPSSEQAADAERWLIALYVRNGRYHDATRMTRQQWAARPGDPVSDADRALAATLAGLPDLAVTAWGASTLQYMTEGGDKFAPAAVNGRAVKFTLDTDSNISVIAESEATRLGLSIQKGGVMIGGASGARATSARTAVADRLDIGNVHLASVAFVVVPDTTEPFAEYPLGERGVIGLPVLIALRSWGWKRDGQLQVGAVRPIPRDTGAELGFDGVDPVTRVTIDDHRLDVVLDTGAEETEWWPPFAREFADVISRTGKKSAKSEVGYSGRASLDAMTLPTMSVRICDVDLTLTDTPVLMRKTVGPSDRYYGRLGMDLLNQARRVTIDFISMRIIVE